MFGHDKNTNPQHRKSAGATSKDGGVTILTAGCHFSGKLYCKGATRIGGTIEGEVIAEGLLIIEEDAVINANVRVEEVVVHGRMEGSIQAQRKIEMCPTADVQADISTPSIVVHEGAMFNGKTSMKKVANHMESDKKQSKSHKDSRSKNQDIAVSDANADQKSGIAARTPEITFA